MRGKYEYSKNLEIKLRVSDTSVLTTELDMATTNHNNPLLRSHTHAAANHAVWSITTRLEINFKTTFNLEKQVIACNYVLINIITSNNSAYSSARQKLKTTVTGDL